mmetsp:Transcript_78437/g.253653  ORF Transcript_78437/g.253653 Transcript_78437/m.253653 type:complete len:393 (+) Transcript_78437:1201-2379(+)
MDDEQEVKVIRGVVEGDELHENGVERWCHVPNTRVDADRRGRRPQCDGRQLEQRRPHHLLFLLPVRCRRVVVRFLAHFLAHGRDPLLQRLLIHGCRILDFLGCLDLLKDQFQVLPSETRFSYLGLDVGPVLRSGPLDGQRRGCWVQLRHESIGVHDRGLQLDHILPCLQDRHHVSHLHILRLQLGYQLHLQTADGPLLPVGGRPADQAVEKGLWVSSRSLEFCHGGRLEDGLRVIPRQGLLLHFGLDLALERVLGLRSGNGPLQCKQEFCRVNDEHSELLRCLNAVECAFQLEGNVAGRHSCWQLRRQHLCCLLDRNCLRHGQHGLGEPLQELFGILRGLLELLDAVDLKHDREHTCGSVAKAEISSKLSISCRIGSASSHFKPPCSSLGSA